MTGVNLKLGGTMFALYLHLDSVFPVVPVGSTGWYKYLGAVGPFYNRRNNRLPQGILKHADKINPEAFFFAPVPERGGRRKPLQRSFGS
ncbi:MAG: hypothetical protein A2600_11450 [Candidatus Lambdaproteobacteria bacterium RIFOXYD1_FULL_56_27]|uniref:Uncharacterized protein n=1 Tax=Candidatus Lambdaproteobacteria bacterium RIFOXYD2_FULL_56_26 TaxID=1817773 RepID=A0A1F6H0R9_9PROT|nr:MAG: hypothetical protein A2426_12550 [Candidatus Lambdaproteobacteria bacterium RIFOXYC1_FULL_56_13]OGH03986.1 MAG: hypothetical protein A2557_11210 [Candidatus Lambdaproteobacteria bacterium RIFOXYD2_FULL_56_26]OGH08377.1 MAG: hypothetical protein A2600_11450 [Candidatus Lambdaproteobacteria bacterium RIFOXYD1_FULL_56_27]